MGEDTNIKRPYIGVVLTVNDHNYFVSLSSPKKHDFIFDVQEFKLRKHDHSIVFFAEKMQE